MVAPKFSKVRSFPWGVWRASNIRSVARHAVLFGALAGAVLVSLFHKFATLGIEPTPLPARECDPSLAATPAGSGAGAAVVNNRTAVNVTAMHEAVERRHAERVARRARDDQVLREAEADMDAARSEMHRWIRLLQAWSGNDSIITERTSCREITAKGQTCAFEGLLCLNVSNNQHVRSRRRPIVYVVDDRRRAEVEAAPENRDLIKGLKVPSDDWCYARAQAADPRYYSSRHWPFLSGTVVPQHSCMDAWWRTSDLVLNNPGVNISWVPSIALLDLDYDQNSHNTHLAMDTLWLLDAQLYQDSLSVDARPGYKVNRPARHHDTSLISPNTTFYMPQHRAQFDLQLYHEVNRLMYAIIFRKNASLLYPPGEDLKTPTPVGARRPCKPLLDAYDEFADGSQMKFHLDIAAQNDTDLICTSRVTAGFKTGFTADERMCRHIRSVAFDLYGIDRPTVERLGYLYYPRPPKKVLILSRHVSRRLGNGPKLHDDLKRKLAPLGVDVSFTDTNMLFTAEEWVRVFSSAGIIISPHGSHNMGMMFMHRHAALIEIMPVGYTEFSFSLLSEPCRIQYYEVPGMTLRSFKERYEKACNEKIPHVFSPCNDYKSEDVWTTADKIFPTVLLALERLGYDTGTFLSDLENVTFPDPANKNNESTANDANTTANANTSTNANTDTKPDSNPNPNSNAPDSSNNTTNTNDNNTSASANATLPDSNSQANSNTTSVDATSEHTAANVTTGDNSNTNSSSSDTNPTANDSSSNATTAGTTDGTAAAASSGNGTVAGSEGSSGEAAKVAAVGEGSVATGEVVAEGVKAEGSASISISNSGADGNGTSNNSTANTQ